MTQEEKQLVLQDLCARLPYGVKVTFAESSGREDCILNSQHLNSTYAIEYLGLKPYLRPMSSMTEEEILELYKIAYDTWYSDSLYYKNDEWISFRSSIKNNNLCFINCIWLSDINKVIDYLNKNMFDYRGLIHKDLAIEVTKNNNPYKN